MTGPDAKVDIDWAKTIAGALAAMTSAVLLSTLGAVGTIIGAAVGSLAATVGTALYAQGLVRSKEAVAKAQATAATKIGIAQAEVRRAQRRGDTPTGQAHLEHADDQLGDAKAELEEVAAEPEAVDEQRPTWRERLGALPWRRIALAAGATFVVAMVVILAFELLAGRSVSSYTGGSDDDRRTTFLGGNGDSDDGDRERDRDRDPQPSDDPSPTITDQPTEEPSESPDEEPSEEPSDDVQPTVPTTSPTSPTPTTP